MVVLGQKWLYMGKSGCIRAKWLDSGKRSCNRAKVDVFEESGCIRGYLVFSGIVVIFGQK